MGVKLLDGESSVFFARELEHIKAKSYDVIYRDLMSRQIFPVSMEAPPGATSITFRTYDQRGAAKIINNYAKDLPRVDVDGKETIIPVKTIAASFGYTVKEILSSQMSGKSLDQRRANAARRAIEEKMDTIAWFGDADSGLPGFFSNPNIPQGNAPDPGSGSQWVNKTPDEILADINNSFSTVFNATYGKERPDTLLLPLAQWSLIMQTARSTTSDTTIAAYVVNNSPYISSINDILAVPDLAGASDTGSDCLVVLTRDPDKMQLEIPQDVFYHPEQPHALEFEIPVSAEFGGLNIYYPNSAYILGDI